MKKFLVLYDQEWIRREIPTPTSSKFCVLVFRKVCFKAAPMQVTKAGTKIADSWLMEQVNPMLFDGVAAVMNGNRLKGRHGVHIKQMSSLGRFSIMQVEAHQNVYRVWKQLADGTWKLNATNRKTKGAYVQVQYTFEHEIGHAIKYLRNETDDLHSYVAKKQYKEWWDKQLPPLKVSTRWPFVKSR